MPAPTFVAAASAEVGVGTTITCNKPTGVVAGDFMIAQFLLRGSSTGSYGTPPSGWTLIATGSDTMGRTPKYTKIAGGSEPASYTWSAMSDGVNQQQFAVIAAFRGADQQLPLRFNGWSGGDITSPNTYTLGSVDGWNIRGPGLHVQIYIHQSGGSPAYTWPGTWTVAYSSNGSIMGTSVAYRVVTGSGAYLRENGTNTGTDRSQEAYNIMQPKSRQGVA